MTNNSDVSRNTLLKHASPYGSDDLVASVETSCNRDNCPEMIPGVPSVPGSGAAQHEFCEGESFEVWLAAGGWG